jgi:hypothetical protein
MGIDITKDIENGTTNYELFEKNYGEGKLMPGGPTCRFNGKDIPCFVGCSPKSCITPEMLKAMLEVLDEFEVFDRSTGLQPVLLLDGHQSRMKLPFLEYINDPKHLWTVCLGVPYGTHIWQVGDAPQLNGCFKMALAKAKRKYLTFRDTENKKFVPTDVIPLVNMAWERSFARSTPAKHAIIQRGWSPLNYVLLDHPKLRRVDEQTTTDKSDGDNNTSDPSSISTLEYAKGGVKSSTMLQAMISEESKSEGRRKKFEEQKRQREQTDQQLTAISTLTSFTSGQMASSNRWILNKDLLEQVKKKEEEDERKRIEGEQKKQSQKDKDTANFRASYHKYISKQRLSTVDYRNLLRRIKEPTDSPIKTKVAELQQQWSNRKHRLDDYIVVESEENVLPHRLFEDVINTPHTGETSSTEDAFVLAPVPMYGMEI